MENILRKSFKLDAFRVFNYLFVYCFFTKHLDNRDHKDGKKYEYKSL